MNILIVHNSKIPALKYGGIERVIWYLGQELTKLGHRVTYLVPAGSTCSFAKVINLNPELNIDEQIPENIDIVNVHFQPRTPIRFPHLISMHGSLPPETRYYKNTSFVSSNHARRYGADAFVYNGLNWDDYGKPDFDSKREYVHFLGKAAWRLKNVRGAINIARQNKTEIKILGGTRLNIKMGPRLTLTKWARFYGMVGGQQKNELLKHSRGLVFPVKVHEAFGLAIIESLYFGCPVLATTYGSIPEIVGSEFGFLSNSLSELSEAFKNLDTFNKKRCYEYARDTFNSKNMALGYLNLYEQILNGNDINHTTPFFNISENTPIDFVD